MSSSQPLVKQVMRVKNPDHIVEEADHGGLKRSMGLFALLMFSVGSIIGTGIFVILGEAIPKAGPALGIASPRMTKIPVPMMLPTLNMSSANSPILRFSPPWSASSTM